MSLSSRRAVSSGVPIARSQSRNQPISNRRDRTQLGVFANISEQRAIQYGMPRLPHGYGPTSTQIAKYDTAVLYEISYGGSSSYFESPVFKSYKDEEQQYLTDITRDIHVEEGIYTCGNCGYKKIRVNAEQKRSADEGQTVEYQCVRCLHKWQRN